MILFSVFMEVKVWKEKEKPKTFLSVGGRGVVGDEIWKKKKNPLLDHSYYNIPLYKICKKSRKEMKSPKSP